MNNIHKINDNIYITSDEEIKEVDWILYCNSVYKVLRINSNNRPVVKMSDGEFELSNWNKIILTDNKDLIKDGVQPISNEFLEWFVKNPSCEEVEIILNETGNYREFDVSPNLLYKIIIPKEEHKDVVLGYKTSLDAQMLDKIEPKQETLEEIAVNCWAEGNWDNRDSFTDGFVQGAKWQQERSYSEEDMKQAYLDGCKIKLTNIYHLEKWFEQFKKK